MACSANTYMNSVSLIEKIDYAQSSLRPRDEGSFLRAHEFSEALPYCYNFCIHCYYASAQRGMEPGSHVARYLKANALSTALRRPTVSLIEISWISSY